MIDRSAELRPGAFCRFLLQALEASEGQTRRRKRDQTPDRIGLGIRRALLERADADDPDPEGFERWLMARVLASPAGGPVRAMCAQILDEYRLARSRPEFGGWLAAGAPSADADRDGRAKTDAEVSAGAYRGHAAPAPEDNWCPVCHRHDVRDV